MHLDLAVLVDEALGTFFWEAKQVKGGTVHDARKGFLDERTHGVYVRVPLSRAKWVSW